MAKNWPCISSKAKHIWWDSPFKHWQAKSKKSSAVLILKLHNSYKIFYSNSAYPITMYVEKIWKNKYGENTGTNKNGVGYSSSIFAK